MNPAAGYSTRGSDDDYCSVYPTDGHYYVSCHVDASPIALIRRCSICGHISSSDLREQLTGSSGQPNVVHLCPPAGSGLTGCCRRPPLELPTFDRVTFDRAAVTCRAELPDGFNTSDGYHTFTGLYAQRRALVAALTAERSDISWRSRRHHPDSDRMFDGHFIVGIDTPAGPVSYHFELKHWDEFGSVPEREHAPAWDGSTPSVEVERLLWWARR